MVKYEIIISEYFYEELENTYFYIAFIIKEPEIARKLYNKIISKIFTLEYFPEGYPRYNYNELNIRKVFLKNYIIIYKVDIENQKIYIMHLFHSKQNYLNKF